MPPTYVKIPKTPLAIQQEGNNHMDQIDKFAYPIIIPVEPYPDLPTPLPAKQKEFKCTPLEISKALTMPPTPQITQPEGNNCMNQTNQFAYPIIIPVEPYPIPPTPLRVEPTEFECTPLEILKAVGCVAFFILVIYFYVLVLVKY